MKETGILFKGEMVRAIIEDRKNTTRRLNGLEEINELPDGWSVQHIRHSIFDPRKRFGVEFVRADTSKVFFVPAPHGEPGDRLWVRENGWERPFRTSKMMREGADTWAPFYYDADGLSGQDAANFKAWAFKRRPSIHMPKAFSRLTLELTDVRVERLQDITEEDAMAEGVDWKNYAGLARFTARKLFCNLWKSINGKRSWDLNPWVWVETFRKVKP